MEIEKTGENAYKGVSVTVEDGRITGITDTNTGTHKEIRMVGEETRSGNDGRKGLGIETENDLENAIGTKRASWDVWDTVIVDNAPVNLYFYDLNQVNTRKDPATGELLVLDERGNPLCYADSVSGMAYVYGCDKIGLNQKTLI